jgi:translocation and assembly module TamB
VENLLALALATLIVMSTGWFQRVLERRVIANLTNLTGGRVEISHFRFKPWLFQITMQKLVIHGLEPAGAPPLVSVRDVEAGISPRQLLHRRLRLRYVDMDEFQVHLRTTAQGITNLPGPGDRASGPVRLQDLMDLSIGRLTISHSAFFWNDQRQPLDIDAHELAILLRGIRGQYNGALSSAATTIHSPRWSSGPVKFNGRFELSSTSLVFSPLAWDAPGASGETTFTVLLRPDLQATGSYHASTEMPALARILHAPELRSGTLQVEGVAVYQNGSLSARGRAQARQAAIFTPAFPSLRLDATTSYALERNRLNLTNLLVSLWGGTVQGTMQANFQDSFPKFRLDSHLHQIRLDNLLRSPQAPALFATQLHPVSVADGALSATWSGQWQGLEADFDLALHGPTSPPAGALPVSGAARGTLTGENGLTLHLADADLQTPYSTISARGTIAQRITASTAVEPLALTLTTNNFEEWRPFFQALVATPSGIPLELKSQGMFSGQLSGSIEEPFLQGSVKFGQFRYHGWAWEHLAAVVALNSGLVQITGGHVENGKSSFQANASAILDNWRLTPTSVIHVSAQAQQTEIEGLKAALNLDLPVRGSVSGRMDVEGTVADLAGTGAVQIDAGAIAGEPFDSFSAQLRVAKSIWKLQNLQLRKKQGSITGDITLEPERRFASGQLQGSGFRLADIHRLPLTTATALHKGGLDGELSFEARGEGTPENFHLQNSWRLVDVSIAGTALGEFHGTLTGEGQQLTLQGEGQSPGENVHFHASTTAQGAWPLEADGEYSHVRADPWIRAFLNREFGAAVTLDGSFHATGALRAPENINLQSRIDNVTVTFPTVEWRNTQPIDVRYSSGKLALSRFVMRGPSTELNIEGTVGVSEGVSMDLRADGSANASLLTVFDANLQATGRSALRLRLTGTPTHPLLNGVIDIQDMSVGYNDLPFRFNNLQGTINLESERAVINSLRGTCGGGTVSLTGFVILAERPRFEVRADLGQVRVRYPSSFTSVLDGNLRLSGGVDRAELQGDLDVRQFSVNENINIIGKIIESSNAIIEQTPAVNSPVASKIRLNVRVTSTPPVQLQTPNLRMVGDIDLRLEGTVANPVQVGSIHFLSGETVFRGNRYTLERGDISMPNPFHTQAYLDLETQTRVQNYDLTLDITGPFDRLKFSYRSDPPLAQTDIISLLALGYVPQDQFFPALQGNSASSVGASAILSQALSSQIGGRIQRLFGVSRIKIDPYVGMPGLGSGERVTVEEQVTRELTLTYITDTSYSQYTIVQFEWNVTNNVSILGVRDPNGVFGIEFRFRRRFK